MARFIIKLITVFIFLVPATILNSIAQSKSWTAPAKATELKNPFTDNPEAIKAGKKNYIQLCIICHGDKGKGDGIAGVSLNPQPSNLTSKKVQQQTDGELYWKITKGNPPMASYEEILSEEERWQLVTYIRELAK